MSDVTPYDVGTKLIITQTEPGFEQLIATIVIAGPSAMWFPCCPRHGGKQHVVIDNHPEQDGMYAIKWLKPWLDDLDLDQKDVDAIRGLTTPNKSDALTKMDEQIKETMDRLANNYLPRRYNEH